MIYNIHLTQEAKNDLRNIFSYITFQIPETPSLQNAKQQIFRLEQQISSLEEFQNRYRVSPDENLQKKDIRIMPVDNYHVHYTVNKKTALVSVVRIIYNRCNIDTVFDYKN